jgi:NADPH:quinone reductase-like Zn-dependent oxidoreductase
MVPAHCNGLDEAKARIANALCERVWPLLETGKIKIVIHRIFPFPEVAEAHRIMERGEHAGEIVLRFETPAEYSPR